MNWAHGIWRQQEWRQNYQKFRPLVQWSYPRCMPTLSCRIRGYLGMPWKKIYCLKCYWIHKLFFSSFKSLWLKHEVIQYFQTLYHRPYMKGYSPRTWRTRVLNSPLGMHTFSIFALAYGLRFWQKIKQFDSNYPASNGYFAIKQLIFTKTCKNQL